MSALLEAASFLDFFGIKEALEAPGVDVNEKNEFGETALHLCISKDYIVQLLLSRKADPNVQNNNGSTPLHKICALYGDPDVKYSLIIKLLREAKADSNIRNTSGFYPEQYIKNSQRNIPVYNSFTGNEGEKVRIPREKHGAIIGTGGSVINQIILQSRAIIVAPRREEASADFLIYGRKENIERAKQLIYDIVPKNRVLQEEESHGQAEIKCPIPKGKHALISAKGTLDNIQKNFHVKVIVPKPEEPGNVIRIIGEPNNLDAAIKHIHEITTKPANTPPYRKNYNNNKKGSQQQGGQQGNQKNKQFKVSNSLNMGSR